MKRSSSPSLLLSIRAMLPGVRCGALVTLFVTLSMASPASLIAHDMWLVATPVEGADGAYRLALELGEHGHSHEQRGLELPRARRAELVSADGITTLSSDSVTMPMSRSWVAGIERDVFLSTLPGSEFDEYLKEEGHTQILGARRHAPDASEVRERYTRHLKAIVIAGEDDALVTTPIGHEFEITPLENPARVSERLKLVVTLRGAPVGGTRVTLCDTSVHDGVCRSARTSSDGVVSLPWPMGARSALLRTTWMTECGDCDGADYQSYWAATSITIAPRNTTQKSGERTNDRPTAATQK